MSGGRQFVQRLAHLRNLAAGALVPIACSLAIGGVPSIEPRTLARAYAPGEIVRFEVATGPDVTELDGTFRGTPLTFIRAGEPAGNATWVAWGVIPLDAAPGAAGYELTAKRVKDSPLSAQGELEVSEKSFPEQRLTVESKFVNPPKAASERIAREKKQLDAIYARRTSISPPASPFVKPVPGGPTSEFGTRRFFNGELRSPHAGIDLEAATGTPVLAAGPGRVALATDLYYSGGTVIVDHGGGLFTIYAHLSKIGTKAGATVKPGDRVGLSGATGRVTGPHLHWGARVGASIFDPRALLDPRVFGLP
jgi:murein DD-endopeptidase MepM/ murein hydrolase activator NlpD